MPTSTGRLNLVQPVGSDAVSELRLAIAANAASLGNPPVAGAVNAAGSVVGGSGFTVAHTASSGVYTITFSVAFPSTPAVIASLMGFSWVGETGSPEVAVETATTTEAVIYTTAPISGGVPTSGATYAFYDAPFSFLASP